MVSLKQDQMFRDADWCSKQRFLNKTKHREVWRQINFVTLWRVTTLCDMFETGCKPFLLHLMLCFKLNNGRLVLSTRLETPISRYLIPIFCLTRLGRYKHSIWLLRKVSLTQAKMLRHSKIGTTEIGTFKETPILWVTHRIKLTIN